MRTWQRKRCEKMKKITNLLLALMLLTSLLSFALVAEADEPDENDAENDSDDVETVQQIQMMQKPLGARIRLLQLEKSIIINLLKGNMTVQILKGFEVNTTELETILENLTDVLYAVKAIDPDANDSVALFVELKNESRNLTKQFRDAVHLLLDEETIALIKEKLKDLDSDELQQCKMRIRHWIRQFNHNQLYRLFGLVGEVNTSLLEEYLNGTVNLTQVRLHFNKLMNQMNKEKRNEIFSEVKEENIQNRIKAHEKMKNMGGHGSGKGHGGRP